MPWQELQATANRMQHIDSVSIGGSFKNVVLYIKARVPGGQLDHFAKNLREKGVSLSLGTDKDAGLMAVAPGGHFVLAPMGKSLTTNFCPLRWPTGVTPGSHTATDAEWSFQGGRLVLTLPEWLLRGDTASIKLTPNPWPTFGSPVVFDLKRSSRTLVHSVTRDDTPPKIRTHNPTQISEAERRLILDRGMEVVSKNNESAAKRIRTRPMPTPPVEAQVQAGGMQVEVTQSTTRRDKV